MDTAILSEILALKNATLGETRAKYTELYGGKEPPNISKLEIWKKIAYKIQEREYGGLSEEAEDVKNQLIKKHDPINNKTVRSTDWNPHRDKRLPIPGTIITKTYKGTAFQVQGLERGFECNGHVYKTLGSVARAITGAHWSGYLFFNL